MALSQKHSGKILVPWFNISEWKFVYNLIYNEETKDWPRALEMLKIWKLRTPLLSAGVEGTLIVLGALGITSNLTTFEISHIYSTSLVRFLNLCVGNSDKQGTFYKSAMKSDLPKWLISLRHEIAHSHRVPSLCMLELSMKYCINWLKDKYWDVQLNYMSDLVIEVSNDQVLDDALYVYLYLTKNPNFGDFEELDECVERLEMVLSKNTNEDLQEVCRILQDRLMDSEKNAQKICDKLMNNFKWFYHEDSIDGVGKDFLDMWSMLLNVFNNSNVLLVFIKKLFDYVCNETYDESSRRAASLWIGAIFQGLINHEQNLMLDSDNSVQFEHEGRSVKDKEFINTIFNNLSSYTLNFIKQVLEYNNAPNQLIEDSVNIINIMSGATTSRDVRTNGILTVDDIDFNFVDEEVMDVNISSKSSAWTVIEDTTEFRKLPLGVLPHQSRSSNPCFNF